MAREEVLQHERAHERLREDAPSRRVVRLQADPAHVDRIERLGRRAQDVLGGPQRVLGLGPALVVAHVDDDGVVLHVGGVQLVLARERRDAVPLADGVAPGGVAVDHRHDHSVRDGSDDLETLQRVVGQPDVCELHWLFHV